MRAPTMEAGMKQEIRKFHGHRKTKEVFSFDDGSAEQQGPFLTVARPILAAFMNLDSFPNDEGEGGQDPEVVQEMLEDALVLLGNGNVRLNVWRQRRFSDYLTDLGRRTLPEGITTERHLFPHQFHEKIKSSSLEQTGRGDWPSSLEAPVLSTTTTAEVPDERRILTSRL